MFCDIIEFEQDINVRIGSFLWLCLSTMLFGEVSPEKLKTTSSELWNGPQDSDRPRFFKVKVVGAVEGYHAESVCVLFFFFFLSTV